MIKLNGEMFLIDNNVCTEFSPCSYITHFHAHATIVDRSALCTVQKQILTWGCLANVLVSVCNVVWNENSIKHYM